MTIINTGYSTLQDAWGEDFNKKKKTKKTKTDPLCDLYSKQYAKSLPPYTTSKKHTTSPNYPKEFKLNQHDYDKYYGYSDAKQFQRTRKKTKNLPRGRSEFGLSFFTLYRHQNLPLLRRFRVTSSRQFECGLTSTILCGCI